MIKVSLVLPIFMCALFFTGCKSIKSSSSSKKAQVVTLNDSSNNNKIASAKTSKSYLGQKNTKNVSNAVSIKNIKLPSQLISYMEGAVNNNKKILEAKHDILATNEQHNIQKAAFKPVIDSVSGISNRPFRYWGSGTSNEVTVQAETSYSTSLRTRWNLFRGGADVAKLESIDKQIEAKWKGFDTIVQDVLLQTIETYVNIVAKQKEIENINSLINARKESIKVAVQMNNAGVAKEVDVIQARAAYAEAEAKLSVAEAQEQSYMAQLSEITGLPVSGKLQSPEEHFDASLSKLSESEALETAKKFNPKIMEAQASYLAALSETKEPVDKFSPSLDLEGGFYATQTEHLDGVAGKAGAERTTTSLYRGSPAVAVNLTIPIYSGGSGMAKKRQLVEKLTKARVVRERTLLEIQTGIKQSREMIEAANENITSAKKAISARNLSLKSTLDEQQAGTKITKDVLEEQQKLFEAQQMLAEAIKDKFNNSCKLLGYLGHLNPKYLGLRGDSFDCHKEFAHQKRGIITRYSERHSGQNKKNNKKTPYLSE